MALGGLADEIGPGGVVSGGYDPRRRIGAGATVYDASGGVLGYVEAQTSTRCMTGTSDAQRAGAALPLLPRWWD